MPSSELGYVEPFDAARDDASRPATAGHLRRLIGNVDHIGDQISQRRVNWWPINPVQYFEPETTATFRQHFWYRLWHSTPFDVHLFTSDDAGAGLRSYGMRVRLHGASKTTSGTTAFRVVVSAENAGSLDAADPSNPFVISSATNVTLFWTVSTSHTWLVPDKAVIYLDTAHVQAATRSVSVANTIGGITTSASWLRCTAEVWGLTDTSNLNTPRVSGLIVDEYWTP